jgi:Cu2+-exporting ATPase
MDLMFTDRRSIDVFSARGGQSLPTISHWQTRSNRQRAPSKRVFIARTLVSPIRFRAQIGGAERLMCCAGCKAVAEAIAGAGLSVYYDQREAPGARAAVFDEGALAVYDAPAYQQSVVHASADGSKEISLLISGISCAACVWLIERRLQCLNGVLDATINFSNLRARVRWDDRRTRLSAIIAAIRSVGYQAEPFDALRSAAQRSTEQRRSLWRRSSGFGMMQS